MLSSIYVVESLPEIVLTMTWTSLYHPHGNQQAMSQVYMRSWWNSEDNIFTVRILLTSCDQQNSCTHLYLYTSKCHVRYALGVIMCVQNTSCFTFGVMLSTRFRSFDLCWHQARHDHAHHPHLITRVTYTWSRASPTLDHGHHLHLITRITYTLPPNCLFVKHNFSNELHLPSVYIVANYISCNLHSFIRADEI